ncbi:MAG: hypothetical protein J5533_07165 [Bacteroidales bacterium]|nr:hypothetical protein [Bacteroidales bacterium]
MKIDFTQTAPYAAPQSEWICLSQTELLCQSPDDGGIEDVDFEDWTK